MKCFVTYFFIYLYLSWITLGCLSCCCRGVDDCMTRFENVTPLGVVFVTCALKTNSFVSKMYKRWRKTWRRCSLYALRQPPTPHAPLCSLCKYLLDWQWTWRLQHVVIIQTNTVCEFSRHLKVEKTWECETFLFLWVHFVDSVLQFDILLQLDLNRQQIHS